MKQHCSGRIKTTITRGKHQGLSLKSKNTLAFTRFHVPSRPGLGTKARSRDAGFYATLARNSRHSPSIRERKLLGAVPYTRILEAAKSGDGCYVRQLSFCHGDAVSSLTAAVRGLSVSRRRQENAPHLRKPILGGYSSSARVTRQSLSL